MRLYKTELYKLCRRKIFPIGIFCILAALLILFLQDLRATRSTVNGVTYHGYEAVRIDRQITQEFEGVLTDERIQQIVDQYGFPKQVEKYYGVSDGNFLNRFVMAYASDGYLHGWDDYRLATKTLPLAETALGQFPELSGDGIWFAYYDGWSSYTERYYISLIMTCILILCTVSTVFSDELQSGIKPLLFTTKEGPARDICAKIAVAFTLSFGLWLMITGFSLLLYGVVYGWEGLQCLSRLVSDFSQPVMPFGTLLTRILLSGLLGVMELCAVTLLISARCHSTFHSVTVAAFCWVLPVAAFLALRGIIRILLAAALEESVLRIWGLVLFPIQLLLYSAPFYLTNPDIISELDAVSSNQGVPAFCIVTVLAVVIIAMGITSAWRRYRKY